MEAESQETPPAPQTEEKPLDEKPASRGLIFSQSARRLQQSIVNLFKGKKSLTRQEFYESIGKLDLEKQAEMLADAAEGWESYGWEFVCEDQGVTITRSSVPHTSTKCTRGIAVLKATPKEVFDIVRNAEIYKQWDERVVESKFLHQIDARTSTCYFEFAPWYTVAARDVCFLQYLTKYRDGTYVVSWHSVDDPSARRKKGVVRATMGTSGFVIAPLQKQSLVTFVLQFDLNGWIPTVLDQAFVASQPMLLLYVDAELKKRQQQAREEAERAKQLAAEDAARTVPTETSATPTTDGAPSTTTTVAPAQPDDADPDREDVDRKIRQNQERRRQQRERLASKEEEQPATADPELVTVFDALDPFRRPPADESFAETELGTVQQPRGNDEVLVFSAEMDTDAGDDDADSVLRRTEELLVLENL